MTADEIRRPSNGYVLSLYDGLRHEIPELRGIVERTRAHIVQQQAYLATCEQRLADAESTLAWMLDHQADEIAALEAGRAKVRKVLKQAGWFKDAPSDATHHHQQRD